MTKANIRYSLWSVYVTLHYTIFFVCLFKSRLTIVLFLNTRQNSTHFSVIATSYDVLSIWRIRQGGHVVEVTLLLEDVGLALPLPHQQLTLT